MAKTEDFKQFAHNIAMQIAAANPSYVAREEVPQAVLDHEREILRAQALKKESRKVIDKMVEGRLEKYFKENCLLEQPYKKIPIKLSSR